MSPELQLSKTEREALKAIHRMTVDGQRDGERREGARTGDLATHLGLTPGTITSTLKRMAENGLVEHHSYRGATLTEKGLRAATMAIRRHRIVETFLAETLNYSWQDADRLAPTFEHVLPAEIETRIFEALGNPKTCPHGFSIPEPDGETLPAMETLYELYDLTTTKKTMKEQTA